MTKKAFCWIFAAAVTMAGVAGPATAAVYKWVDEDGITHYSQEVPPKGQTAEVLDAPNAAKAPAKSDPAPPAPAAVADDAAPTAEAATEEERKQQLLTEIQNRRQEEQDQVAKACAEMRRNLEMLETRGRVRTRTEEGLVVMTPEQQADKILQIERDIAEHCQSS